MILSIDQPTRCELHTLRIHVVKRHVGTAFAQTQRKLARHHGIFEKAAGVAQFLRIGKFAAANPDHRIAHALQRRAASLRDLRIQVAVTEPEHGIQVQCESHRKDDRTAAQFTLEHAVPVTESARFTGKHLHPVEVRTVELHLADHILHLGAVRPDILHRRGAHITRNQREVLHSAVTAPDGPCHEIIPLHTGFGTYQHLVRPCGKPCDTPRYRVQDRSG